MVTLVFKIRKSMANFCWGKPGKKRNGYKRALSLAQIKESLQREFKNDLSEKSNNEQFQILSEA